MNRTATLLIALTATGACKSKTKTEDKPVVGSGSVIATIDAVLAPATNPVKLPSAAKFGCIGWNAATKSVACITGEDAMGEEPRYQIDYINSDEPPTKLAVKDRTFGDVTAANATLAKLGIEAFPSPAKTIKGPVPGDSDLGGGALLVWAEKIMDEGGDNRAPTTAHEVSLTCANKQSVDLEKVEQEGISLEFHVWSVPGHVVIEEETHIGREGESRASSKAALFELATCKLVDTAG